MKPGIPWSVKGIEPEVREAAKHAARRSGMTLGEWLNSAILDQTVDNPGDPAAIAAPAQKEFSLPRPAAPQPRYASETTVRLEDIAQQLSQLARREQESAAIMPYEPPSREHDTLNRILNRVESNERQTVEAFTAVNERLSVLGRQIAMSARQKAFEKPEDVPGFSSLETAIRNVVEHIEVSEGRTRETLKSMQDRLAEMASRAAAAPSDELLRTAPSFLAIENRLSDITERLHQQEAQAQAGLPKMMRDELSKLASRVEETRATQPAYAALERRMNDIGQRLQQHETQVQQGLPKPVRDELARLAGRIDEVRSAAHDLASEAQSQAVAAAQKELRDIEQRIHGLLRDAQAAMNSHGASAADVNRLRGEISGLNRRIDEQLASAASAHDVEALRVAVEQLSARVAQGPDLRPIADLDRRLADIAARVDDAQEASRNPPHLADLNRRVGELDQQLRRVISEPQDSNSVAALEHQLAAFNDRLARTEEQLGHFGNIERAIAQLYDAMEQGKETARQTAEDAANRAAERVLQQHAAAAPAEGSSAELRALQDGLKAVRHSAELSDQRSQETLSAVHETLEQIVGKLAELETSAAGHQLAMSMAQQATAAAPASAPAPAAFEPQPLSEPAAQAMTPPPAADFFDPLAAFADPAPVHVAQPAAPVAAEAEPPVAAPPAASAEPAVATIAADDYIAAARRLAMAANNPAKPAPSLSAGPKPANAGAAAAPRRFKLPFEMPKLQRKPKPMTFSGGKLVEETEPAAKPVSRRTLIIAGIALLVAASLFGMRMMTKSVKPVKQTSAIEQTISPAAAPSAVADNRAASASAALQSPSTTDDLVTGSLPAQKTDASLTSLVAEPGAIAEKPDTPPAAIGVKSLRDAAAAGDPSAQFVVASRYLDGQYVTQDFTRAAYWYQQAASRGLAPAEYRIGTLFERGRGVPQDTATALVWYERAAEAGNVKAMHNAAVIAAGNQAGTPNFDKAFRWFKEAAQHGLKDSQYNLAVLYERGLGSKPDVGEAYVWYRLAAKQGDTDAGSRADLLKKTLTPTSLAAADARVNSWQPMPDNETANTVAVTQADWNAPADAMVSPDDSQPKAVPQPQSQAPAAAPASDPVKSIQQLLQKLGYNIGNPDGRMGTRTVSAIRLFQLQSGMKVTGEVTPELLSEMQAKAAG